MRKTALAAITLSALALAACTSDNVGDDNTPGAVAQQDQGAVGSQVDNQAYGGSDDQEIEADVDQALLDAAGTSDWADTEEGWAGHVMGTDVNVSTLLIDTNLDPNDGDAVETAEQIGNEAASALEGERAAEQLTKITVSYNDGRGAYTQQINGS